MNLQVLSLVVGVFMASFIMVMRMRSARKPASAKKIILPPFFMSTGALMYVVPQFRLTPAEMVESIVVGLLFSVLLIKTSKFEVRDAAIYLKPSKAFMFIIVGLFVIRIAMKWYLSSTIDVGQLSGMFFLLAFSMLVPWRIAMYLDFKKLERQMKTAAQ